MVLSPLTLQQYQETASETDRTKATKQTQFLLLGLFGEAGTLLDEVKKKQRDTGSYIGYEKNVEEELGDVLWYLAVIAGRINLALSAIAKYSDDQIVLSYAVADTNLRFIDLQPQALLPFDEPTPNFENTLLRLVGAIGALANAQQQSLPEGELWGPYLRDIFQILVQTANEAGVTLDKAAQLNLIKIFDRWPTEKRFPPLFDEASNIPEEKLPRKLEIEIYERVVDSGLPSEKHYVLQRCNKILIGDRVTDNIIKHDDYRFHDAFHYSYAAVLGWSPVLRALFRLKRKSNQKIDEGQDGARAILVEEGVSTFIFAYAKELHFFEGQNEGELSFTLLKRIREFVAGYEPETCPLWLWEKAILDGYAAFRFLRQNRKGRLTLDLTKRSLSVSPL